MTGMRWPALAGGVLMLLCGCSGEKQATAGPAPAGTSVVLTARPAGAPTPVTVRVPVPSGWRSRGKSGADAAALIRPVADECEYFVQLSVAAPDAEADAQATRLKLIEAGDGRSGATASRYRLYDAPNGLVFDGGATGAGGMLIVDLTGAAPGVRLIARGGPDGPGCFELAEAPPRHVILDLLREVARTNAVKIAGR